MSEWVRRDWCSCTLAWEGGFSNLLPNPWEILKPFCWLTESGKLTPPINIYFFLLHLLLHSCCPWHSKLSKRKTANLSNQSSISTFFSWLRVERSLCLVISFPPWHFNLYFLLSLSHMGINISWKFPRKLCSKKIITTTARQAFQVRSKSGDTVMAPPFRVALCCEFSHQLRY